ncbi:MAG TPA: MarR family transcriptional regulator [Stellaceae bacterium]|nr:MarR family transcriptional regulator [Stellaceae bacterium]
MRENLARLPDRESASHRDDKIELKVWLRLLTCTSLIEAEVRSRLRSSFDTTLPRFDLLAQLDRAGDGLTMGELGSRLMVTGGNITGLVDALAAEGLVERAPHARDRRSRVIRLTAKGRRAFAKMAPVHERWIDAMMAGMGRAEMTELLRLLGRLKDSVRQTGGAR